MSVFLPPLAASPPAQRRRLDYLSNQLIVECHPGDGQEPLHLMRWWKRIFSLLGPTHTERFVHVVDRNSIHGSSNMSDIIDEEPLNSPDSAYQRPSNRWRPHMRG